MFADGCNLPSIYDVTLRRLPYLRVDAARLPPSPANPAAVVVSWNTAADGAPA
jgi:hypothetical protein